MIDPATVPVSAIDWPGACRVIRSRYPPIDLFDDIADPADWALLLSAEQKTNPRLMENLGAIDMVPAERRVAGAGASYLMAPFTQISRDRPSRFSDGRYGVLYAAHQFETALMETVHHHSRFMAHTGEPPGWTSQFREILIDVTARLHDLRSGDASFAPALSPDDYTASQQLGAALRAAGSDGIAYPSQRHDSGECVALFYPDRAANPVQARHLDYHWNGSAIDFYRDAGTRQIFRIS